MVKRDHEGYYYALGISPDASTAEIKAAYRRLAKRLHPDASQDPQDQDQFYRIGLAYDTLKNADRRLAYDVASQALDEQAERNLETAAERDRLLRADLEQIEREVLSDRMERSREAASQPVVDDVLDVREAHEPIQDTEREDRSTRRSVLARAGVMLGVVFTATAGLLLFPIRREPDQTRSTQESDALVREVLVPTSKLALVIGNSDYLHTGSLPNARRNASAIGAVLEQIGSEVIRGFNLSAAQTTAMLASAMQRMAPDGLFLFYYAGHGMQVSDTNYLVPTDARLYDFSAIQTELIEVEPITSLFADRDGTAIILLDSCRDNPLAEQLRERDDRAARALGLGMAEFGDLGGNTLYGFATGPGRVAQDGTGQHSPFAAALLRYLGDPELEIQQIMTRVKKDVFEATSGAQFPWHSSNLRREVYLAATQL